jgi:cytochrome c553
VTRWTQDIAEKAQLCDACHGEDGKPKEPDTPIIWGQYTGYLYIELRDYKSGLRKNDKMSPIAADLSKDDMMALAQYFLGEKVATARYLGEQCRRSRQRNGSRRVRNVQGMHLRRL